MRHDGGRLHPTARLSAAGLEVLTTDRKIIDIALEFGYDSPDSFTKRLPASMASHLPHCEKAEARSVPLLRFGSK